MSEIDDIFASKGSTKVKAASAPNCSPAAPKKEKKDKRKKSKPIVATADLQDNPVPTKKRPLPETIVDPSTLPTATKRRNTDAGAAAPVKRPKTKTYFKEEKQFRDSRGTGPRRKTEEGWNIYKEDELRLNAEAGDTPLCPFDCQCCF